VAVLDNEVAGKLTPQSAADRIKAWQQQPDEVPA
jgi:hypothetical protein